MNFNELINISSILNSSLRFDFEVMGLSYDSRKTGKDFIFFAIKGYKDDGNKFVKQAIENGARAVITDVDSYNSFPSELIEKINLIAVKDTRKTMAEMSCEFFGRPSEKLKLVGITGTNGKTTITYLLKSIFEESGYNCGLIGTIDYQTGNKSQESKLTTPDSIELNMFLSDMLNAGIEFCFMEVSSIALVLKRVYGLKFFGTIFTNLTSEHLDLHQNMENYFNAKKILFDTLENRIPAVSNADDEYGETILNNTNGEKIYYSINNKSEFQAINYELSIEGLKFELLYNDKKYDFNTSLTGKFNIYNILSAIALSVTFGIDMKVIQSAVSKFKPVSGRFNKIKLPNNSYAIVDYSHTSDSLKNAIESAVEIRNHSNKKGKVITIFGCGGNKDKTKRPVMGEIATALSDYTIISSDNPRFEEPMNIIEEILTGVKTNNNFEVNENREEAIKRGIEISSEGDLILICGKGHETYQEVKGIRSHFDDREIVEKYSYLAK